MPERELIKAFSTPGAKLLLKSSSQAPGTHFYFITSSKPKQINYTNSFVKHSKVLMAGLAKNPGFFKIPSPPGFYVKNPGFM